MCDPLTITGVALSAASMVANAKASAKVAEAREDAMEAERIRQKGYQKEADAVNDKSQSRYSDFQGQQDAKAENLGDYLDSQSKALPSDAPTEQAATGGSSNVLVQKEIDKQQGKTAAYGAQQNQALGKLRSFGDLLGGISREQAGDATALNTIGGLMKGSNAVLPYELEDANSAGNGWKTAGTVLGTAGSIATTAGLGGGWNNLSNFFTPASSTATLDAAYAANPSSVLKPAVTVTDLPLVYR